MPGDDGVLYLVPADIVEAWRSQFRQDAADHPEANYARRADADLRRTVTDVPSDVREQAAEAADKLGRYLNARKLRDAPPPPAIPPPPEEALLLPPDPALERPRPRRTLPTPPAQGARPRRPLGTPTGPPAPRGVKRRRLDMYGRATATAADDDDDDDEVELFDQEVFHQLLPTIRPKAREMLRRIRQARPPGVTFGPGLGRVFVDGRAIPDMGYLLNDALGTRLRARSADSPGYNAFMRLIEGSQVPTRMLSLPYQSRAVLRHMSEDGEVGEELEVWRSARSPRGIKRPGARSVVASWVNPPR